MRTQESCTPVLPCRLPVMARSDTFRGHLSHTLRHTRTHTGMGRRRRNQSNNPKPQQRRHGSVLTTVLSQASVFSKRMQRARRIQADEICGAAACSSRTAIQRYSTVTDVWWMAEESVEKKKKRKKKKACESVG